MRGVYERQINQDCSAYQAFKDLVTDRAGNKGTISLQKTNGALTGLQCAKHRFYHSESGYDRKAMVDLRKEFFGAIYDEIVSNTDNMLRNTTGPAHEKLKERINAVLKEFHECILPSDPDMNLDFKRTDMERIIKNVEKLKESMSVDVLLEMDARELVHLAEGADQDVNDIMTVKYRLETVKSFSASKGAAIKALDAYMPKNLRSMYVLKEDDPLLQAGTKLFEKIFPNAKKGELRRYAEVLEKRGIQSLTINANGALAIKRGLECSLEQVLADLKELVNAFETICIEERDSPYWDDMYVRPKIKPHIDDFTADVNAIKNAQKTISPEASKIAADARNLKAVRYTTTLHDIGSRFGRDLNAAVNKKDVSSEERKAAVEKSLREFAGGMFADEKLAARAEEFKAIAARLSDPERTVDFLDGFNQAVDLLESCKATLDRPVDKARCERKIKAFKEAFLSGRSEDQRIDKLSGADRGALAAMGASRAAAKGKKPLVAFLKETFKEHFSALGSGGDEDKKILKDALKLLSHISLDMYKDERKFDYAMKKLEECFTKCADRLGGQDAVAKKAFLADFLPAFVEKIKSTRTEWKSGFEVPPALTPEQLELLKEFASYAKGDDGDTKGYMGFVDGQTVKFLTNDAEIAAHEDNTVKMGGFAKALLTHSAQSLMHQLGTLMKNCSLETKDAVQKMWTDKQENNFGVESMLPRSVAAEIIEKIAEEAVGPDGQKMLDLNDIPKVARMENTTVEKIFNLQGIISKNDTDSYNAPFDIRSTRIRNCFKDNNYKPKKDLKLTGRDQALIGEAINAENPVEARPYSWKTCGSTGAAWSIYDDEEDADVYVLDFADITYAGGWVFQAVRSQEERVFGDAGATMARELMEGGNTDEAVGEDGKHVKREDVTDESRIGYKKHLNPRSGVVYENIAFHSADQHFQDRTIKCNMFAGAAISFEWETGSRDARGLLMYFLAYKAEILGDANAKQMLKDMQMSDEDVARLEGAEKEAYERRQSELGNAKQFIARFFEKDVIGEKIHDAVGWLGEHKQYNNDIFKLLVFGGDACGFDLFANDTKGEFDKFLKQAEKIAVGDKSDANLNASMEQAQENYLATMESTFKGWFQMVNAMHNKDSEKKDVPLYFVIGPVGAGAFKNNPNEIAICLARAAVRYGGKIKFVFPAVGGDHRNEDLFNKAFEREYYKLLKEQLGAKPEETAFSVIENLRAISKLPEGGEERIKYEMTQSVETCFSTFFGGKTLGKELKESIVAKLSKAESFDDGLADLLAAMKKESVVDEKGQPIVNAETYGKFLATLEEFAVATIQDSPQRTLEQIVTDFELDNVDREGVCDDARAAARTVGWNIEQILNGNQPEEEKSSDVKIYLNGLYRTLFEGPEGQMPDTEEAQSMIHSHLDELDAVAEKLSRKSDKASVQEGIVRLRELLVRAAGDWAGWSESLNLPIREGGQLAYSRFSVLLESDLNVRMIK